MDTAFFSVLIVNFNGGHYVQAALDSLKRQTFREFEVILLDNASSDGSIENLDTTGLPAFLLLKEEENHGFARGNNVAAKAASGQWLALLNPDAEADLDWLEKVREGIEIYPQTKTFACTQISLHNPDHLDGAGDNYLLWGIPWRGGFGRNISDLPPTGACFSPCGASAIYERDTFLRLDGFDERFFCFCEDVDLGYRLRLRGETCRFLPDAIIHHAGGGLSDKVSGFALEHGSRNRLWVYIKNTPLLLLLVTLPGHAALTLMILLRGLMTGRFSGTLKGITSAVMGLLPVLKDRREIQKNRTISYVKLIKAMPWNPFIMLGRKTFIWRDDDI